MRGKTAAFLGVLVVVACAAAPADRPAGFENECRLESSFVRAEFPSGSQIELLLAAGNTIPAGQRTKYSEMARQVVTCAADGASVEIIPITETALVNAPVFSGSLPAPMPGSSNPLRILVERKQFMAGADEAVRSVLETKHVYPGSDPLGALYAAGQSLRTKVGHSKHTVIVLANGWQQTKQINLFAYRNTPARAANRVVAVLQRDGILPDLRDADVVLAGISRGDPKLAVSDPELAGLCRFWETIIRSSGGKLRYCAAVLPGLTAPI